MWEWLGADAEWWVIGGAVTMGFLVIAGTIGGAAALLSEVGAERWKMTRELEVTEEAAQKARMTTAEAMKAGEALALAAKKKREDEKNEKAALLVWAGKNETR